MKKSGVKRQSSRQIDEKVSPSSSFSPSKYEMRPSFLSLSSSLVTTEERRMENEKSRTRMRAQTSKRGR